VLAPLYRTTVPHHCAAPLCRTPNVVYTSNYNNYQNLVYLRCDTLPWFSVMQSAYREANLLWQPTLESKSLRYFEMSRNTGCALNNRYTFCNIKLVCTMAHRHPLHWAYVPGWIRSFRDVGWDDEDLMNGLQEVQIPPPMAFSCEAGQRRRCTGQNLAQWKNWRTGFGTLSPTSHTTSCRRLWIPSPVFCGCWLMPPVPTLNFNT